MIEHWEAGLDDVAFDQFRLHTKRLHPWLEERWAIHNAALRRSNIFNSRAQNQNSSMGKVFHACGYDALMAAEDPGGPHHLPRRCYQGKACRL